MHRSIKSKLAAVVILAVSFFLCLSLELLEAQDTDKGSLTAFVYGPDKTTPLAGAVIKIRNVQTGSAYESLASDSMGQVELQNLDEGLYIVGISFLQGDFNVGNLVGIRPDEEARISFALSTQKRKGKSIEQDKKKRSQLAYFSTPSGTAVILAASDGVVTFRVFSNREPSGSPFK
jgi:hypothetical protein